MTMSFQEVVLSLHRFWGDRARNSHAGQGRPLPGAAHLLKLLSDHILWPPPLPYPPLSEAMPSTFTWPRATTECSRTCSPASLCLSVIACTRRIGCGWCWLAWSGGPSSGGCCAAMPGLALPSGRYASRPSTRSYMPATGPPSPSTLRLPSGRY